MLIGLLVLAAAAQFFRIDRSIPEVDPTQHFEQLMQPPAAIASTLKNACYDCHSYETQYPWYAGVAPVSWILANHIKEGREHLNFSIWGTYSAEDRPEILEEMAEVISEGEMPLAGYAAMHPEARLDEAQKSALIDWLATLGAAPEMEQQEEMEHEEGEEEEDQE